MAFSNNSSARCPCPSTQPAGGYTATALATEKGRDYSQVFTVRFRVHAQSFLMYSRICQNCRVLHLSFHYLPPKKNHPPSTLQRTKHRKQPGRRKPHLRQKAVRFINVGRCTAGHRSWNAISGSITSHITSTASNRAVTGQGIVAARYEIISQTSIQASQCLI